MAGLCYNTTLQQCSIVWPTLTVVPVLPSTVVSSVHSACCCCAVKRSRMLLTNKVDYNVGQTWEYANIVRVMHCDSSRTVVIACQQYKMRTRASVLAPVVEELFHCTWSLRPMSRSRLISLITHACHGQPPLPVVRGRVIHPPAHQQAQKPTCRRPKSICS